MEVPYVSKEVSNVVQLGLVMIVMEMVEGEQVDLGCSRQIVYQTFCHDFLLDIITLVAFVWLLSCMSYQMTQ